MSCIAKNISWCASSCLKGVLYNSLWGKRVDSLRRIQESPVLCLKCPIGLWDVQDEGKIEDRQSTFVWTAVVSKVVPVGCASAALAAASSKFSLLVSRFSGNSSSALVLIATAGGLLSWPVKYNKDSSKPLSLPQPTSLTSPSIGLSHIFSKRISCIRALSQD